MAHALGWPRYATTKWHRVAWVNPHRNYYCGSAHDPDWLAAEMAGLADREPSEVSGQTTQTYWRVTPLGRQVLRVWLLARKVSGGST